MVGIESPWARNNNCFFFQDVKEAMKLNNKNMGKRYIEGSFISLLHLSRYQGGACAGIYLFMNNSDTLL